MSTRAVYYYVWATCLTAGILATGLDWSTLGALSAVDQRGLATLVVLGLLAEWQALTVKVGRNAGGASISFLPLLVVVLLFGPAAAVLSMLTTGVIVELFIRRKGILRASFNIGQYTLSTALGGYVFAAAGGEALVPVPGEVLDQLGPFMLFGVVFLVANNTLVAGAISLSQNLNFGGVWRKLVGPSGTHVFLDLLIGPIALAPAALYQDMKWYGLAITIFPLFFIRHSYLTNHQLQQANQDLLRALVKAIETRDPYTSGHSLRVSHLARRIAERLALSHETIDRVETAALLHDVGKIESVYTGILSKPEMLTPEERTVIQSHVEKGVELLRKLTSLPDEVILSVKHHHERHDGGGYPDGLSGDEIPVGARIIAVCDAVDAMLSDRPYRRALPVPTVLDQLRQHAGTQFDPTIVGAVIASDLVGEYADVIRASRNEEWPSDSLADPETQPVARGAATGQPRRRHLWRVAP